jgi:hypothetical protein
MLDMKTVLFSRPRNKKERESGVLGYWLFIFQSANTYYELFLIQKSIGGV